MPTPLESAIAELQQQIDSFTPALGQKDFPGSSGYFQQRALVLGRAYLSRIQTLGVDGDVAATERLYKAGTIQLSQTAAT